MKTLWSFFFGVLLFLPTETRADDPPYLRGLLTTYQDDQGWVWDLLLMTEVSRIKLDGQDLEAVEFDDETKFWKFYKNSKSTLDLTTKLPKDAPQIIRVENLNGVTSVSFADLDEKGSGSVDKSSTTIFFDEPQKFETIVQYVFQGRGNLNKTPRQQNSSTDNANHLKRRTDAFKELEQEIELLKTDPQ